MSQTKQILRHLRSGRMITQLEALELFGCLRLSARIYDLRDRGHDIETTIISVGKNKKVARYRLKETSIKLNK